MATIGCMSFNHAVFWTDKRTVKHQDSVEGAIRDWLFLDAKYETG